MTKEEYGHCFLIGETRFCRQKSVFKDKGNSCIFNLQAYNLEKIIGNCQMDITKTNSELTYIRPNYYQYLSSREKSITINCQTGQYQMILKGLYNFKLDENCTNISSDKFLITFDNTASFLNFDSTPFNTATLFKSRFEFTADFDQKFKKQKTLSAQDLDIFPLDFNIEELANFGVSTIISWVIIIFIIILKYGMKVILKCFKKKQTQPPNYNL